MANEAPITLEQLFRFYRGLPHQAASISQLEQDLAVNGYAAAMRRDRAWFATWSQDGKQADLGAALKLIMQFEGCHLDAYPDPATGDDPWTIGWGTTTYSDGRRVRRGDKINAIEADMLLRQEVDRIAEKLRTTVPFWQAMADQQKCALLSFAHNLGSGFYGAQGFETISRRLKDKDWAKVPDAMLLYRNPGSNVEKGLRRRREAEGKLWLQGLGLPQPIVLQQSKEIRLKVPYEAQNDNASGTGYRECFSSSCAMLARYWGKVGSDDAYNLIRAKYGDSTNANAQVAALKSLGLNARFIQDGTTKLLENELIAGRPVAVGWLHHGSMDAPTGGGHWSVVIGCNPTQIIHNDPNGEANIVAGGYVNHSGGAGVAYSRKNWIPRWRVNNTGGWAVLVSPQDNRATTSAAAADAA